MKLEECAIAYAPYSLTSIKKIEKGDLLDGKLLSLPKVASKVDEQALPHDIKPRIVFIPNTDYIIYSQRLKKKTNANFVLNSGTKLTSLFDDLVSPKVVLPNTLKIIKTPGFQNSKIDELEIPNSVKECDSQIFDNSKIKHLIINEKLLENISAKFLLTTNSKVSITVKNDENETNEYTITKIDNNSFIDFYIEETINIFIENVIKHKQINNNIIDEFKQKMKLKLLRLIKIKLLLKKNSYTSINKLVKKDKQFNTLIQTIINIPDISTDGYSIKVDNKKVKMLTIKDIIN